MAKQKKLYGAAKITHSLKQDYGRGESMAKGLENIAAASEKVGIIKGVARTLLPGIGHLLEKRR